MYESTGVFHLAKFLLQCCLPMILFAKCNFWGKISCQESLKHLGWPVAA